MAIAEDNLEDHMVKLVAYTIVSVKRDQERVMPGGEETLIVTDSMSRDAFTGWIIARYFQSVGYSALMTHEKVTEEDKKYLRLHYTVTHRWPRQPGQFQEREIRALEHIRDHLSTPAGLET